MSVVVNQRPEESSHHALSAVVVKRSQLALPTAKRPSATCTSSGWPLMLTRHIGVVLTTTSGSLPAGGAGMVDASGWMAGSAAWIAFSAASEGFLPAMYGPV